MIKPVSMIYRMTQNELYEYALSVTESCLKESHHIIHQVVEQKQFLFAFPRVAATYFPVLVAHLDVMDDRIPAAVSTMLINMKSYHIGKDETGERYVLGADDRNGVYTLLKLMDSHHKEFAYLLTCDSEKGLLGVGNLCSNELLKSIESQILYFVEIDRKEVNHLACYRLSEEDFSHNNEFFKDRLAAFQSQNGFQLFEGTKADITTLCESTGICGINISAGYFNEHEPAERSDSDYLEKLPGLILSLCNILGFDNQYKISHDIFTKRQIEALKYSGHGGKGLPA